VEIAFCIWQSAPMRIFLTFPAVILSCFVASALPAPADPFMSADEFDEYTLGKTFYYGSRGSAYGAEEYLEGRRVRWSFLDGKCQEGEWYQDGELICFVYETQPDPQCWSFERGARGLIARFENNPQMTELYEVKKSSEPLHCLGPDVGV